jgi:hypothetical protein
MNTALVCREIDLDQAAAGMTLAVALLDANGGVLLPRDAALTDSVLASLRRRGVRRCVVWAGNEADDQAGDQAGDQAHAPAGPSQAQLQREHQLRVQRLERLFRHSGAGAGGRLLLERLRAYRNRPLP